MARSAPCLIVRLSSAPQEDHGVNRAAATYDLGSDGPRSPVVESCLGHGHEVGPEVEIRRVRAGHQDAILALVKRAGLNNQNAHCKRPRHFLANRRAAQQCVKLTVRVFCETVGEGEARDAAASNDKSIVAGHSPAINDSRMPGDPDRLGRRCCGEVDQREQSSQQAAARGSHLAERQLNGLGQRTGEYGTVLPSFDATGFLENVSTRSMALGAPDTL